MKDFITDNQDLILKILGVGIILFFYKKIIRIFKGADGVMSANDLAKLTGYTFFLWAAYYVITKEGTRPANSDHVFSELWLALIFGGLLTVLHMEHVLDKVSKIIELIIRLKSKAPIEEKKEENG